LDIAPWARSAVILSPSRPRFSKGEALMMEHLQQTSTIFGGNMPYIEEQYENYLADPASVDAKWRDYFDAMRAGSADVAHQPVIDQFAALAKSRKSAVASIDAALMDKQLGVMKLIRIGSSVVASPTSIH
jgi:2-oxoglutarate dehydrogenase complex dehydrogenase (E1) component-like enzyme